MAKPFSEMTLIERHVNRWRMKQGLHADYTERTDEMAIGYDDAGIRRAMRIAVDEATTAALAREKAAREVERDIPQLRQHVDELKSAEAIYLAALEYLGCQHLDDIKTTDAKSLGAVFSATINALKTGNNKVAQAQDASPRALRELEELRKMSPNFARIIVNRD